MAPPLLPQPRLGAAAGLGLGLVLDGLHLGQASEVPVLMLLGWWWGRIGRRGLPIERIGVQSPGLSGVFLLERGSLLHFGMNLKFTADNGATWQLSEIRRVRLNEKNYYDNPGLGVIAVVTPVAR